MNKLLRFAIVCGALCIPEISCYCQAVKDTALARFDVTVSKKEVFVGECFTVNLSFSLEEVNRARLRFHDLGNQVLRLKGDINSDRVWKLEHNIDDVIGEEIKIQSKNYTTYKIYAVSLCPVTPGVINFPSQNLEMKKILENDDEKIISFKSVPTTVDVQPHPTLTKANSFDEFPLFGEYTMTDNFSSDTVPVNSIVDYSVVIDANSLTFPIRPPDIKINNCKSSLTSIIDRDTVINNSIQSTKRLNYQLIFTRPGVYDFNDQIAFTFFNPKSKAIETVKALSKIVVTQAQANQNSTPSNQPLTFGNHHIIAIDISKSMLAEDYHPSRLEYVKRELNAFLAKRKNCNIGILLFAGHPLFINPSSLNSCYSIAEINKIECALIKERGTAIGDAIWHASLFMRNHSKPNKIVIIGDGDDNAGHLDPAFAVSLIKNSGIEITSIGIGSTGFVPLGKDTKGQPALYDNTFTDFFFNKITEQNGGRYYKVEPNQSLSQVLEVVFSEP